MNIFVHRDGTEYGPYSREQIQEYLHDSMGGVFPMGQLEEMGRQNMAMFEKAMQMFSPFGQPTAEDTPPPGSKEEAADQDQIDALEKKLDALQAQIEAMSRN